MTKYIYYRVIQGRYGDKWEDVDFHECDSSYWPKDWKAFKENLDAYWKNEPGPFRWVRRRELRQS